MDNVPEKRLDYPTQKIVFRYLRFGVRKEMHRRCSVPVPKQTNYKIPYNFNSVTVNSTDTGSILITVDRYEGKVLASYHHYTYEFDGQRVIRKQLRVNCRVETEEVFETGRRKEENVKAFLEFLLKRENSRIRRLELETFVPNLELIHLLGVTDFHFNEISMHSNLLSQIRAPVRKVYCRRNSQSSTVHNLASTAKKVNCKFFYCRDQLNWVNGLAAQKISLDMESYDGCSTEVANFLKGFALMNKEMNSQLKLKGDVKNFREILQNVKNDTQNNWIRKYFNKTECASLTKGSQEVILHIDRLVLRLEFKPIGSASAIAPPMLRMPFDVACKIFQYLPYSAREAIHNKCEYIMKPYCFPVQADEIVFENASSTIKNATEDGKAVQRPFMILLSLRQKGSFIKHLIGNLNNLCLDDINLHVETLTLDSDEAFPETFANIFATDALPKVINANCQETTKHLGKLLKNAEVIYKNGSSDDGPPAKKAKLAVSDQ